VPEPLSDPSPDVWGIRHVALECDHPGGCDVVLDADIRAANFAEALPLLIRFGRSRGWGVTDDGRIAHCRDHALAPGSGEALLGLPGGDDA
jgi:hypothetical protein